MSRMNSRQWQRRQSERQGRQGALRRRLRLESLEERRLLAVLRVSSPLDNTTADGALTLREATLLVNSAGDAMAALGRDLSAGEQTRLNLDEAFGTNDTIRFLAPLSGATILLDGAQLELTHEVSIDASALPENVAIDAQQLSRVLRFSAASGDLTLNSLNIHNGKTTLSGEDGGGIRFDSAGVLTLTDCLVDGNTTTGFYAEGGGVFSSSGAVTLTNSTVSGNDSSDSGGGIYTKSGAVTLTNSTVSGNTSALEGGGVYSNSGAVTLTDSAVSGNTSASHNGGGIYVRKGAVTLTDSTVSGNASGSKGGGISAYEGTSKVTLTGSTVSGNSSASDGGGIRTYFGNVTLTNSTVSGNDSGRLGGGIFAKYAPVTLTDSAVSGNTSDDDGGGIYARFDTVTLIDSTVSGNDSGERGGGVFIGSDKLTLTNSTVNGNTSVLTGGGIHAEVGKVEIIQSTVSGNSSQDSGGGLRVGDGGLTVFASTFTGNSAVNNGGGLTAGGSANTISGSIFAGNTAGGVGDEIRLTGDALSLDAYNLIGRANVTMAEALDGVAAGPTDILATSDSPHPRPLLAILNPTLADNGGLVFTHALPVSSPARDAGDPAAVAGVGDVPEFDQRGAGFDRVSGRRIDIGAFEVQAPKPPSADFDADGDVDGFDFLAWQRGFGAAPAAKADGDADNDDDVDADDLAIWQLQFGPPAPVAVAAVQSAERLPSAEQPLAAGVVDAALAMEWISVADSGEEDPLGVEPEWEISPALTARRQLPESTSADSNDASSQIASAESDVAPAPDEAWLSDELIARTFD